MQNVEIAVWYSGTDIPYPAGRPSVGPVGMVNFWGRLAESIIGVAQVFALLLKKMNYYLAATV